jgi:hypothetical protein
MVSCLSGKETPVLNCWSQDIEECDFFLNHLLSTNRVIEDRIYIEPHTIYVTSHSIFLHIGDLLLPIRSLSTDENGVFVTIDEIGMGVGRKTWTCTNADCGYVNYDGIDKCAICGTSRYGR